MMLEYKHMLIKFALSVLVSIHGNYFTNKFSPGNELVEATRDNKGLCLDFNPLFKYYAEIGPAPCVFPFAI